MNDDLNTLLTLYPAIARPSSAPEPLGNAGGTSGARLWKFPAGCGTLVLRCWPRDGPTSSHIAQIHRWLAESSGLGFVPVPLPARDGRTLIEHGGGFWELAPWLPGESDLHRPPTLGRMRAGFSALAAFHRSLAYYRTRGKSPGLGRRDREISDLMLGGFNGLERAVNAHADDPRAELGRRWLALARPLAHPVSARLASTSSRSLALQPCLRDVRPHHLLFQGDRLTGLIDFGAMDIETVAGDLARLLLEWVGPNRPLRAHALAAYTAIRPLDEAETALIEVFEASSALLSGGHWVRWHFVDRRTFDDPNAITQGLERGVDRLKELAEKQALV